MTINQKKFKVLVCGGREYLNSEKINEVLNKVRETYGELIIIQGEAKGADFLAKCWAFTNDQEFANWGYKPDWNSHGPKAGSIRNVEMHDDSQPDLVIGFPGGVGTAHMMNYAKTSGTKTYKIVDEKYEIFRKHIDKLNKIDLM